LLPTLTIIGLGLYILYTSGISKGNAIQVMGSRPYLMPFVIIVPVMAVFFPFLKVKVLNRNHKFIKKYIYPSIIVLTLYFTIYCGHHFK